MAATAGFARPGRFDRLAAMTSMTVNGEPIHYRLDPDTPLLWALRDASNLTGTKYGCDSADCGACTVLVDGRALLSCTVSIAALEGADVVTVEGLAGEHADLLRQAWTDAQVTQCGFCDPGYLMALAALLRSNPRPSSADLAALPNLCRCGTGPRILKALARAASAAPVAVAASPPRPAPDAANPQ